VGFGDVNDDRQAKAETIRARGPILLGALEGLEQAADLVWRYERPGVGHGGAGEPITLSAATFVRDDLGAMLGAALLAALGVAVGSLIRSEVAGIVGVLIWALVIEPVIGGLFPTIQPYLPYTAATTLAGARLGAGAGGFNVNVHHGAVAAVPATPLPFGTAVAVLGALVIVISVIAACSRLRADVT
jgi:hypothetical protein